MKRFTNDANQPVRQSMVVNNVPLWKLADRRGISEASLCRMLRHELNQAEQASMIEDIEDIANGR